MKRYRDEEIAHIKRRLGKLSSTLHNVDIITSSSDLHFIVRVEITFSTHIHYNYVRIDNIVYKISNVLGIEPTKETRDWKANVIISYKFVVYDHRTEIVPPWLILPGAGNFIPNSNNTYDIGSSARRNMLDVLGDEIRKAEYENKSKSSDLVVKYSAIAISILTVVTLLLVKFT